MSKNKVLPDDYCTSLITAIESIIDNTNTLSQKENYENYETLKKINYQMRYGTVNLLRIIVMHYLSNTVKNKVLSYADWVITPTANLSKIPIKNLLHGAKVYTGLLYNAGNSVENTAIFFERDEKTETTNVFHSDVMNSFYKKSLSFLETCLLISRSEKPKNIFDSKLEQFDPATSHALCNPHTFKAIDSYIYGLFLTVIRELSDNYVDGLIPNIKIEEFPEEYFIEKRQIEKSPIELEGKSLSTKVRKLKKSLETDNVNLIEFSNLDHNLCESYTLLKKEHEKILECFKQKNFTPNMSEQVRNIEEQQENGDEEDKPSFNEQETKIYNSYLNEKIRLSDSLEKLKEENNKKRLYSLIRASKNSALEGLKNKYFIKMRKTLHPKLSIPVLATRSSGHA